MKQKKKILTLFFLCALTTAVAFAQDDLNPRYKIYNGKVDYKKPSTLKTLSGLTNLIGNNVNPGLTTEDKSMVDGVTKGIFAAAPSMYRLIVQQGEAPKEKAQEQSYVLNATISNCMSGTEKYGATACADIDLQLINLQTGQEVAKHKYTCLVNMGQTVAMAIAAVNTVATEKTISFLTACLPLTGSVLKIGVEQTNGKVKDKQCYIDLGEKYGVYKKLKFLAYIDDNGSQQEIGELKLVGTEGDDIGVCEISSGKKDIAEALQRGQKVMIKSNESLK